MMPKPEDIYTQMKKITTELIALSLCSHQKFPVLSHLSGGYREVGIGSQTNKSFTLKNLSYKEIYSELEQTQNYNIKMLDGALIQVMYLFRGEQIERHRLAFFPSPFLEEFQNNPGIYLKDEIYADVIKKNIVPFPLRFDFDCRDSIAVDVDHPKSHLTLGQYQNCRIPVSAPMTPYHFITFVLRSFYNTAFVKYSKKIPIFSHIFEASITSSEKKLLHIQTPA